MTEDDQKEYKARNSLYKKGIFHGNPEIKLMTGQKSEYKNEEKVPKGEIPVHQLKKIEKSKKDELKWIWFRHLNDTSSISFIGPKRFSKLLQDHKKKT